MKISRLHLAPLGIAIATLFLAMGCQSTSVEKSLTADFGGNDMDAQMEFWHRMNDEPITTNDDAFHGVLLYLDGTDPANDYAGRVATLKSRGMLPKGFDRPANQAVERGYLAITLMKVVQVRGGLMLTLLGPTPRYATRELQYIGLYPVSSPQQTFTGSEFVGIIGRLEDYQRGDPANKPAAVLPNGEQASNVTATQPAAQ